MSRLWWKKRHDIILRGCDPVFAICCFHFPCALPTLIITSVSRDRFRHAKIKLSKQRQPEATKVFFFLSLLKRGLRKKRHKKPKQAQQPVGCGQLEAMWMWISLRGIFLHCWAYNSEERNQDWKFENFRINRLDFLRNKHQKRMIWHSKPFAVYSYRMLIHL